MEFFSPEFFSALLAIVVIDLVLAGDNAIVIALAARNLPPHLRNKAVAWGTIGAIVVRTAMTVIVVWLLKIPGLLLAGGAMLLWIAYKLLINPENGEEHHVSSANNFWGAMRTIVVADAVMGLDNVLAVAGAANGSFMLVVLGLLISIPIVIWGSQLILKYVQRYPAIIYIGAGVLAWTGVKMITTEPLTKTYFVAMGDLVAILYLVAIGGVLAAGFRANYAKVRERVAAHIAALVDLPVSGGAQLAGTGVTGSMQKVLIPVDGPGNALCAVRHAVTQFMSNPAVEMHLLHVRAPFSRHVAMFTSRRNRESYHRDMAERALKSARKFLNDHGVPHAVHVEVGDKAEVIDRLARRLHVDKIVMGTARKNSLTRLIEDSVSSQVLDSASVPVEIVVGQSVSTVERVGVPVSIAALVAFIVATAV